MLAVPMFISRPRPRLVFMGDRWCHSGLQNLRLLVPGVGWGSFKMMKTVLEKHHHLLKSLLQKLLLLLVNILYKSIPLLHMVGQGELLALCVRECLEI